MIHNLKYFWNGLRIGYKGLKEEVKPRDYLLIVESSSRRLENRIRKYAGLVFKGCFIRGVTVYHIRVESLEMLRRLKISLKQLEHVGYGRILKFEPLLKKDDIIFMVIQRFKDG